MSRLNFDNPTNLDELHDLLLEVYQEGNDVSIPSIDVVNGVLHTFLDPELSIVSKQSINRLMPDVICALYADRFGAFGDDVDRDVVVASYLTKIYEVRKEIDDYMFENHYDSYKEYALDHYKHFKTYPFSFIVEFDDSTAPKIIYRQAECRKMLDRMVEEKLITL